MKVLAKTCSACKQHLCLDNFYISKDRHVNPCKSCRLIRLNEWRKANHDKVLEQKRLYNKRHAVDHRAAVKEWVKKNKDAREKYYKAWLVKNSDKTRLYNITATTKIREKVLSYYGKVCNICGLGDEDVLVIDHVYNNGAIERKLFKGKYSQYKRVVDLGFPEDYQILCCNCNWKKHKNGGLL